MKRSCLYSIVCVLLLSVTACVDEKIRPFDEIPEGETTVDATVEFNPLTPALETRAAAGDAIKNIESLCVLVYGLDGKLISMHEISDYTVGEMPRKDPKPGRDTIAESKTPYARFSLELPYGRYHIYAVANMGDMASYENEVKTIDDLKKISFEWKSDVTKNNQMLGHFTEKGVYSDDSYVLTINRKNMEVRAGIRRLASKVTLAFDGSNLKEGVFVYIKSVQIKDIPQTCPLGDPNTPATKDVLITEGDTIRYDVQWDPDTKEMVQVPFDELYLARVTKGRPYYPHDAEYKKAFHTETERSLYFYENMQGEGKDKRQALGSDGKLIQVNKDDKPYGTYIEVQAYYRSIHPDRLGNGNIIYRFMLGKNVTTDYNAERNHHYKLTLCFKNFANDVDWHIDYNEPMPSIQVPEPYYISYLYNHSMMLPVKVNIPEGAELLRLNAVIDTNSWAPYDVIYLKYHEALDPYRGGPIRNWNGFLSLRKTTATVIAGEENVSDEEVNKNYYNTYKKGIREYDVKPGWHRDDRDQDGNEEGAYYVSVGSKSNKDGMNQITFQIPMYTRAKQLVSTSGYTGNNPYVAYQRKSVVEFTAEYKDIDGVEKKIIQHSDIRQVRRVVNPKGVWRKAGNSTPFHVVLKRLPRENATKFETFTSEGKWKAYIISSTDDFINLGSDTVRGSTGSPIDFSIGFKEGGTYSADGNRCAIIRVEYHDYSCFHLIFVRQGDAPMAVEDKNKSKWHAYNMRTKNVEAQSVAEEGSLFKFRNWEQPIDATSNVNDKIPWIDVVPGDFKDHTETLLLIAGTNTTKKWDEITSYAATSGAFEETTVNGKSCKVADAGAYNELYRNEDIEFGYGVLYGDDAKETLSDIGEVYGYRYDQAGKGYGMRGIFVYNASDAGVYRGRNMFFPIGASGYGHRKEFRSSWAGTEVGTGVLRYTAGRVDYFPTDPELPLFYDLFMRPGAIYWLDKNSDVYRNGKKHENIIGWDINYFTFDFNLLPNSNVFSNGKSDACFIRCIEK